TRAVPQNGRPTPGTRIAFTGPVRVDDNLLHQGTAAVVFSYNNIPQHEPHPWPLPEGNWSARLDVRPTTLSVASLRLTAVARTGHPGSSALSFRLSRRSSSSRPSTSSRLRACNATIFSSTVPTVMSLYTNTGKKAECAGLPRSFPAADPSIG